MVIFWHSLSLRCGLAQLNVLAKLAKIACLALLFVSVSLTIDNLGDLKAFQVIPGNPQKRISTNHSLLRCKTLLAIQCKLAP